MEWNKLYQALETETAGLAKVTGQRCPPGCGLCCERPSHQIEASEAELRPAARWLWDQGRGESALEEARRAGAEGWCVLYEPQAPGPPYPRGRCGAYELRPLTCRLFGFSAVVDKHRQPQLVASPVMKASAPEGEARFARAVAEGFRPPVASTWRLRWAEMDPRAGTDLLPLNEALARALEQEGLVRRLAPTPAD